MKAPIFRKHFVVKPNSFFQTEKFLLVAGFSEPGGVGLGEFLVFSPEVIREGNAFQFSGTLDLPQAFSDGSEASRFSGTRIEDPAFP